MSCPYTTKTGKGGTFAWAGWPAPAMSCFSTITVEMAVYKRGGTWWVEFCFGEKRIRESAKTGRKTLALEFEKRRRLELERAYAGIPAEQAGRR